MKTLRKLWQLTTLLLAAMPGMARATTTNRDQRLKQRKLGVPLALLLSVLVALLVTTPGVLAASGDFSIDFVAAAPESYNHLTGGGAFDDGTIGVGKDVVESLEGGDFSCGDIVTYLAEVTVGDTTQADTDAPQTIELNFSFLADTTGQSGVALGDIVLVQVNYGTIEDRITDENTTDDGINDDGGSTATLTYENLTEPLFQAGSELHGTVELDDLERNEVVVVRIDVKLFCDPGSAPTGNLQAALPAARLTFINGTEPVNEAISAGQQTVPFKQIGDICFPELEIQKTVNTTDGTCPSVKTLTINAGETVKYCYVVTNPISCAPLYNVKLVDDNGTPGNTGDDFTVTLSGLTDIDNDGTADDLAASGTATGWALVTFPVTTLAGSYPNIATATGNDSIIEPTTLYDNDTAEVIIPPNPLISILKTGAFNDEDGDGYADVGETIAYTYTVTNDGNVDLANVSVRDSLGITVTCVAMTLAPGEFTTCTASYTITQSDINVGKVDNVATATGTAPDGRTVQDGATATVTLPQNPSIDVEKYVSVDNGTTWEDADDPTGPYMICYTYDPQFKFVVTNTGNVDLTGITLTDSDFDLSGCTVPPLAVGASFECFVTDPWEEVQHTDKASATVDFGGQTYSDTDDANYRYRVPSSP